MTSWMDIVSGVLWFIGVMLFFHFFGIIDISSLWRGHRD